MLHKAKGAEKFSYENFWDQFGKIGFGMSTSLILGCLWVLASTVTALLPMRRQMVPGVALLAAAPVLLWFIASEHGVWVFGLTLLAVLSLFRNPLIYFARRAMGLPVSLPAEFQSAEKSASPEVEK